MARILLDGTEISVSESLDTVLGRLVAAKDGVRRSNGVIVAPGGWMTLTDAGSDEEIYIQTERLGYVRED